MGKLNTVIKMFKSILKHNIFPQLNQQKYKNKIFCFQSLGSSLVFISQLSRDTIPEMHLPL